MASAISIVDEVPPRSGVTVRRSSRTSTTANSTAAAARRSPTCRSIIAADRIMATGLAPEASPSPPVSPAQRSETMSPYRFGSRITSNVSGSHASRMASSSIWMASSSISGYAVASAAAVRRNTPSENFMMFALCPTVTLLRPFRRAWSNANRTIRRVRRPLFELDPRVQVLGVLPDHHQVEVRPPALDPGQGARRPDRGEQVQRLAQGDVHAAEPGAHGGGDRALDRRPGSPDRLQDALGERGSLAFHHGSPGLLDVPLDRHAGRVEDQPHGVRHLGPDAVAGDERDRVGHVRQATEKAVGRPGSPTVSEPRGDRGASPGAIRRRPRRTPARRPPSP